MTGRRQWALVALLLDRCRMIAQQRRLATKSLQRQENDRGSKGREGETFGYGEASFLAFLCGPPSFFARSSMALK